MLVPLTLFPDQLAPVAELRACIASGIKRPLLVCPTGFGKGAIAVYMIERAIEKQKRVLFMVNRREIVRDASRRLTYYGLEHSVIMSGHGAAHWMPVQVASVDTLFRKKTLPTADFIICDEAHFSVTQKFLSVLERYDCPVIGMTATPIRGDGKGLGKVYQKIILGPSMADLIKLKRLVPCRIFAPTQPDLKAVHIKAGEYNQQELAVVMDRSKLVGDIVEHWKHLGQGRPTVSFAVNCEHSQHIADQFNQAGITAKHVDANTPDRERDETWAALRVGALRVVSSVGIISYGWDVPECACAILARPTRSLGLYLQQVGRVVRAHPGKIDTIILDHAGNVHRHGFPDDLREWSLEDGTMRESRPGELGVRTCSECWLTYPSTLEICPGCGHKRESRVIEIDQEDGRLEEHKRLLACRVCGARSEDVEEGERHRCFGEYGEGIWEPAHYTIRNLSDDPQIAELQKIAHQRNYKQGWIYATLRHQKLAEHRELEKMRRMA